MKKHYLLLFVFISPYLLNAQTLAYDASYSDYDIAECVDLDLVSHIVKGHQQNVTVTYYTSLINAQNEVNPLVRFYNYISNSEVLYARVTDNSTSSFAISNVDLIMIPFPCCPPPPAGINSYFYCDMDNDGIEVAYLNNLRTIGGFPSILPSFCGLDFNQGITSFHLSQQDAENNVNPISEEFTFSVNTEIYYRTSNTVNSDVMINQFGLIFETCAAEDSDNDGILDSYEDADKNSFFNDDDTDGDGFKNFEDNDDDGDGILTINEDYNNNGNPLDDDTNGNSVPDYLEASVTLTTEDFLRTEVSLYPNPVADKLFLNLKNEVSLQYITIYDVKGNNIITSAYHIIDVNSLASGIYFAEITISNRKQIKRFIKK